jgi:hypothetical protein
MELISNITFPSEIGKDGDAACVTELGMIWVPESVTYTEKVWGRTLLLGLRWHTVLSRSPQGTT